MVEVVADVQRRDVALQASYQLDAMLDMLRREDGNEGFDFVLRASLPRLKALTCVVMSALGDEGRETGDMAKVVHG